MKKKFLHAALALVLTALLTVTASTSVRAGTTFKSSGDIIFAEHSDVAFYSDDLNELESVMDGSNAYVKGCSDGKKDLYGISYENLVHNHKDGNGTLESSGKSTVYGGCYTTPVYHVHSDSCYGTKSEKRTGIREVSDGYVKCYNCGATWDEGTPWPGCCSNPNAGIVTHSESYTYYVSVIDYSNLICGKDDSNPGGTVEYYTPSCGYSEGQIYGINITQTGVNALKAVVNKAKYTENIRTGIKSQGTFVFGNGIAFSAEDFDTLIENYVEQVEEKYVNGYAIGLGEKLNASYSVYVKGKKIGKS